ncbi:hypothetical protein KC356_g310 [Hortaea werneckii]|nr:hypothetical protein KC356_g310 [Hortaea werneckii]
MSQVQQQPAAASSSIHAARSYAASSVHFAPTNDHPVDPLFLASRASRPPTPAQKRHRRETQRSRETRARGRRWPRRAPNVASPSSLACSEAALHPFLLLASLPRCLSLSGSHYVPRYLLIRCCRLLHAARWSCRDVSDIAQGGSAQSENPPSADPSMLGLVGSFLPPSSSFRARRRRPFAVAVVASRLSVAAQRTKVDYSITNHEVDHLPHVVFLTTIAAKQPYGENPMRLVALKPGRICMQGSAACSLLIILPPARASRRGDRSSSSIRLRSSAAVLWRVPITRQRNRALKRDCSNCFRLFVSSLLSPKTIPSLSVRTSLRTFTAPQLHRSVPAPLIASCRSVMKRNTKGDGCTGSGGEPSHNETAALACFFLCSTIARRESISRRSLRRVCGGVEELERALMSSVCLRQCLTDLIAIFQVVKIYQPPQSVHLIRPFVQLLHASLSFDESCQRSSDEVLADDIDVVSRSSNKAIDSTLFRATSCNRFTNEPLTTARQSPCSNSSPLLGVKLSSFSNGVLESSDMASANSRGNNARVSNKVRRYNSTSLQKVPQHILRGRIRDEGVCTQGVAASSEGSKACASTPPTRRGAQRFRRCSDPAQQLTTHSAAPSCALGSRVALPSDITEVVLHILHLPIHLYDPLRRAEQVAVAGSDQGAQLGPVLIDVPAELLLQLAHDWKLVLEGIFPGVEVARIRARPSKHITNADYTPPHTHQRDQSPYDFDQHERNDSHKHPRHKDTIQHQVSSQPGRLNNGGQRNSRIEQDVSRHEPSNTTKQGRLLRRDFPQRYGRYRDRTEDLRAKSVEHHHHGAQWVLDRLQWDEGRLPLDRSERSLVSRFEEIEIAHQGEDYRAYGRAFGPCPIGFCTSSKASTHAQGNRSPEVGGITSRERQSKYHLRQHHARSLQSRL